MNLTWKVPLQTSFQTLRFVFISQNFLTKLEVESLRRLSFIQEIDLSDNPIGNTSNYSEFINLKFDDRFEARRESIQSDSSESESEDWKESVRSIDLNISDSSVEDFQLDEVLEGALPQVAKFTSTGI